MTIDDLFDIIINNDYVTHDNMGGDYYEKDFIIDGKRFKVYVDGNRNGRPSGYYKIGYKFKLGYADPIHYKSSGEYSIQPEGLKYGFSIISTRNKYLIRIRTNTKQGYNYLKSLYYD